jgi:hypothetical protein
MRWLLAVAATAVLTGSVLDLRAVSHPQLAAPPPVHVRPKPKPKRVPARPGGLAPDRSLTRFAWSVSPR